MSFYREVVEKSKKDIVISAGAETNSLINGVKEKFNKNGVFAINDKKIIILDNISFTDLKIIIKKAVSYCISWFTSTHRFFI